MNMLLLSKYHFLLCSLSGSKLDRYQERFLQHWTKQSCAQKLLLANKTAFNCTLKGRNRKHVGRGNLQNPSKKHIKPAGNMHGIGHTGLV